MRLIPFVVISLLLASCARKPNFDVVLRNGLLCDGSGSACVSGGVALNGDTIAKTGDVSGDLGRKDIDVHGQVIAPGFINMMSSPDGLFADGRGLSDLYQGVTLEIFGEGESMGPLTDAMRAEELRDQSDVKIDINWHTLLDGVFALASTHPRTFGNFARVYARYVRDDKLLTVADAVRKMTSLPATNVGIAQRGLLKQGYFADVTVFDPATIQDHATFEKPRQLATGVSEVFVNGVEVIHNGRHTGAKPGRVVKRSR